MGILFIIFKSVYKFFLQKQTELQELSEDCNHDYNFIGHDNYLEYYRCQKCEKIKTENL